MKYKKERVQNRELKTLIENIHLIVPFEDTDARYEHFHVPSGPVISSPKTSGKDFGNRFQQEISTLVLW